MLVGEEDGVRFMSPQQQASVHVGGNSNGNFAQVIGAEGNTQKDHPVKNDEGIRPGKPPVQIRFNVVLDKHLLQDVQVGQDKNRIHADHV